MESSPTDGFPAVRLLDVPVPEDAPRHFPTATVLLDENTLLTSWIEGRAAHRLGVLDLRTGQWRVATGPRGMLRDALPLPGAQALLLTDYALTEIDLATLKTTRRLTAKIGKHNTYLRHNTDGEDDDGIVVGSPEGTMESLVSLASMNVVGRRRRRPAPHGLIPVAAAQGGAARVLLQWPAYWSEPQRPAVQLPSVSWP